MSRKPRSKTRKLQLQSLSILGVVAVVCAAAYFFFFQPASLLSKTAETQTIPESSITKTAHADFPALFNVVETAEHTTTPFTLHYVLTGKALPDALLKDYIQQLKESYIQTADFTGSNNLVLDATVIPYQDAFYSFTLHKRILQQDVQVSSETKYFFYDATAEKFVTFKQLLNHEEDKLATIVALLRQTVEQNSQYDHLVNAFFMQPDYVPTWRDFERFTLANDALTFTFATNSTPALMDIPLPTEKINDLLREAYQLPLPKMANVVPADYVLDPTKKRVAITFDDGPSPTVTPQVLDTLKKYNAKATFYVLGNKVEESPELAKRIVDEGHEIGNHTWTHPNLVNLTDEAILDEYTRTTNAIIQATGYTPSTFRAPYGSINERVQNVVPLEAVMWSIDTLDWKHRNPNATVNIVNANLHNNAIILMHDIHQPTANALDRVLANIQAAGYEMVTISELNLYID